MLVLQFASPAQASDSKEYLLGVSAGTLAAGGEEARVAVAAQLGATIVAHNRISGSDLIRVSDGLNHARAKELLAAGTIRYIEPNYELKALQTLPNDPEFPELWGLNNSGQTGGRADIDIDAPEGWGLSNAAEDIVVGVIDSGVNYLHPDLAGSLWTNPFEIPNNGIDDDGNGVVDDVYGYNAITNSGNPMDDNVHGTHCAGTIAARGNNQLGVVGVAWSAKLMALKFLDANGSGSTQGAIAAIEYAVRMKRRGVNIRVLSNSWGGGNFSQALYDAITAAQNEGMLFVVAAGNDGDDIDLSPSYPASYDHPAIVSVGAIDASGNLATFSNYGLGAVDVVAPGVNILSTGLGSNYAVLSGTSMAAPHVSGIAAMVAQREPSLNLTQLKNRLLSTVKPLATLDGLIRFPGIVSLSRAFTNSRSPLPPVDSIRKYRYTTASAIQDAGLGTRILTVDDGYHQLELPFIFPFYDGSSTRLVISANGRVVPLDQDDAAPTAPDFSNSLTPGISPFHDDLVPSHLTPGQGGVWYRNDGDKITVTWIAVPYALRNSQDSRAEVRIRLTLHRDGTIRYEYPDVDTGDTRFSNGASATIGIAPTRGIRGEALRVLNNEVKTELVASGTALTFSLAGINPTHDFDGDGKSDLVVYRPTIGYWFILLSGTGYNYADHQALQLGLPGDIPLVGKFDADSLADIAVYRPSDSTWYYRYSSEGYQRIHTIQWGLPGDTPAAADYDGDGRTDIAVYRPADGSFFALLSSAEFNREGALGVSGTGLLSLRVAGPGHDLVMGDFNGDRRSELVAVWQPLRFWTAIDVSGSMLFSLPWGEPGDTPIACDSDGDGRSDRYVARLLQNQSYQWFGARANGSVDVVHFGTWGDSLDCGNDYDGDGTADLRRFNGGSWEILHSRTKSKAAFSFGLPGDIPL